MPSFNTVSSIRVEDYLNVHDEKVIKLLNKHGVVRLNSIKSALISFMLRDEVKLYQGFHSARLVYFDARNEYQRLKEELEEEAPNAPLTREQQQRLDTLKQKRDNAKQELDVWQETAQELLTQDGKLDVVRLYEEKKPKTEEEKKAFADEFLNFYALAMYDMDYAEELKTINKSKYDFDGDLSDEESEALDEKANVVSEKLTSNLRSDMSAHDSDKVIDTYQKNKGLSDRIWFVLIHNSMRDALESADLGEIDDPDMTKYGLPEEDFSENEAYLLEHELENLTDAIEITDTQSARTVLKAMETIRIRLTVMAGKEIRNLENLLSDEELKSEKALAMFDSPSYNSATKTLLNTYKIINDKVKEKVCEELEKQYNISGNTTLDEIAGIMDLDNRGREFLFSTYHSGPDDTIDTVKKRRGFNVDKFKNDLAYDSYIKLNQNIDNDILATLSDEDKRLFELGQNSVSDDDKDKNLNDDEWMNQYGELILDKAQNKMKLVAYQQLSEIVSSDKSFNSESGNELFEKLENAYPKFEAVPVVNNTQGVIPTKDLVKEQLVAIRLEEEDEDEKEDDEELEGEEKEEVEEKASEAEGKDPKSIEEEARRKDKEQSIRSDIDAELIDYMADNPIRVKAPLNLENLKAAFVTIRGGKSEKGSIRSKDHDILSNNMKLYIADEAKHTAMSLSAGLIPGREQQEGYDTIGLDALSNAGRLSVYYMYVLATKPEANVDNLVQICSDPAVKKEYFDFCAANGMAQNMYNSVYNWANIISTATDKLKNYKLPDISYDNPDEVKKHIGSLHTFRTIVENSSAVCDLLFNKSTREMFRGEKKTQVLDSIEFLDYIDKSTKSISDTYFKVKTGHSSGDVDVLLKESMANRLLIGKRSKTFKGKTLSEIYNSGITKTEKEYINLFDDSFRTFNVPNEFLDNKIVDVLAGDNDKATISKLSDIYDRAVSNGSLMYTYMMKEAVSNFRFSLGNDSRTFKENEKLEKYLMENNSVDGFQRLISLEKRQKDARSVAEVFQMNKNLLDFDIEEYLDKKFSLLFTDKIKQLLKANNISEMDTVLIDGKTPNELWSEKYAAIEDPDMKDKLLKLEIIRAVYKNDKKIELRNYDIGKDMKLTEHGTLRMNIDTAQTEKMIDAGNLFDIYRSKVKNKLRDYRNLLVEALPAIQGESKFAKEKRVYTDGTDLYKEMAQALKNALDNIDKNSIRPSEIKKLLEEFRTASDNYYNERKGVLFGPRKGKGTKRLSASDEMRKGASDMLSLLDDIFRDIDDSYTFGQYDASPRNASFSEIKNETNEIINSYGKQLGLSEDYIYQSKRKANKDYNTISDSASLKNEILRELLKLNPADAKHIENGISSSDIFKDKKSMSNYDYANNYVCRKYLEEIRRPDYTVEDLKYALLQLKNGNVKEDIERISKDSNFVRTVGGSKKDYYKNLNATHYNIPSLAEVQSVHDAAATQRQIATLEHQHARANFAKRNQYIYKYDSQGKAAIEAVANKLFEQEGYKNAKAMILQNTGYSVGRASAMCIMIYALALEKNEDNSAKYQLSDLMNIDKLMDAKRVKFKEIIDLMVRASKQDTNAADAAAANKELARILHEGHKEMSSRIDKVAEKIDFNDDNFDCSEEYALLMDASSLQYDAWEEMLHCSNEIVELARAEGQSVENYEEYKIARGKEICSLSAAKAGYITIEGFIDKLDHPNNKSFIPSVVLSSILMTSVARNGMKEWGKKYQSGEHKKPLSEWSAENEAINKIIDAKLTGVTIASDEYIALNAGMQKDLKDRIVEGTLFGDVTFEHKLKGIPGYGLKRMATVEELQEDRTYRLDTNRLLIEENKAIKTLKNKKKDASPEKAKYIDNAIKAVKKLGEYLKYDYVLKDSRKEVVKNCYKAILGEKYYDIFYNKGFRGDDLNKAINIATEYLIVHDEKLWAPGRKSLMDKMAYTDLSEKVISQSENALFMGEAAAEINKAINSIGERTLGEKDIVKVAAYGRTSQILRINGKIPNDADTDTPISARRYYNSLVKSKLFKSTLEDRENPGHLKDVGVILMDALEDGRMKEDIIIQELAVNNTREEKRRAAELVEAEKRAGANQERKNDGTQKTVPQGQKGPEETKKNVDTSKKGPNA